MKEYYVYAHTIPSTGEIFYIGKGKEQRIFDGKGRSKEWQKIVMEYGMKPMFLLSGLTEEEALSKETELIQKHKGSLVNIRKIKEKPVTKSYTKDVDNKLQKAHDDYVRENGHKPCSRLLLELSGLPDTIRVSTRKHLYISVKEFNRIQVKKTMKENPRWIDKQIYEYLGLSKRTFYTIKKELLKV